MHESSGIFAQSVGGGGGNGGDSVSISGAIATVSIGGRGGDGGYSSKVDITNSSDGDIDTLGNRSFGIFGQSVGGGGGNGGFAVSGGAAASLVNLAIGGRGGGGGDSNDVEIHNQGTITTSGEDAHGIFAQSVGGGGGSGGFAVSGNLGGAASLQMALGGAGGLGGDGKDVTVGTESTPLQGSIYTFGDRSYGILAQSVGGGGGDGGFAVAGSGMSGTSLNLAFGGSGGSGGPGAAVNVSSISDIATEGDDAHALVGQSIGGGGGSGGFSLAASVGGGTGLNFSFGGSGGTGNAGGPVTVGTELNPLGGTITTSGDRSYGVLAQSIGGGGGAGGSSITGQLLGGQTVAFGFGGDGGNGGLGGTVDVESASNIVTDGEQSYGLLAQSVGGGGGAGGFSLGAAVTAFGGLNFSMGGDGGNGNGGGAVDVNNTGAIATLDEYSHGIVAQSIGGGGGAGGASGTAMVNFSSLIPVPPQIPITGSANFAVSVGGDGGYGGAGGTVNVHNVGQVSTYDDFSVGIYGQSVGGGGGDGGRSVAATANISLPEAPSGGGSQPQMEVQVDFALAMGGDGGNGNSGGNVEVVNSGALDTTGDSSHGIFAQSVGGGGGRGGDARSMTLSIDPSNWSPVDPPPSPTSISQALNISIGGNAGSGNDAGVVAVGNKGATITRGADAYGIFGQSIGGGGGEGGGGYHGLDWEDLGVPEDIAPFLDLAPIEDNSNIQIVVGGQGGSSGNGNDVNITSTGDIITQGDGSTAVIAQSIGAGGGTGGVGAQGSGTVGIGGSGGAAGDGGNIHIDVSGEIDTFGIAAHGLFAQSIGGGGGIAGNVDGGIEDFGLDLTFGVGQNGGNAGDGGEITIDSSGRIVTRASGSNAIFAQSIGGGGGLSGDISTGLGFAGSVGGDGSGGDIAITHDGYIETFGDNSHGIFAQSAGGQNDAVSRSLGVMDTSGNLLRDPSGGIVFGPLIALPDRPDLGGAIDVAVSGDIIAHGTGSHGIFAQSIGDDGNGNISVTISDGMVWGGLGTGAGVYLSDGFHNSLNNSGSISALSGTAIFAAAGNETINNDGVVSGNVDLGAGSNAFNNNANATFNPGSTVDLGRGNALTNAGTLSPGGSGTVLTTALTGNLIQTSSGTLEVDVDADTGQSDLLKVSGSSDLAGKVNVGLVNAGSATPGTHQTAILKSSGDVTDSGLELPLQKTAMVDYELVFPDSTEVQLQTTIDTSPVGLNSHQQEVGNCIDRLLKAGNSDTFGPFGAELMALTDCGSVGAAYDRLSPATFDSFTTSTYDVTLQYTQSLLKRMHSTRSYIQNTDSTLAYSQTQRRAIWMDGFGHWADQESQDGFSGYDYSLAGAAFGLDHLFRDDLIGGISYGQSRANIDIDHSMGHGDIESYFGSLYGSYFTESMYFDTTLSYGRQRYENKRLVNVGTLTREAQSDHYGNVYTAYIESGWNFGLQKWILQPFAALRYTYLDEESFKESGAAGVNLFVNERATDSLVSDLGLRFAYPFKKDDWLWLPEATVAWDYDFDIDSRRIVAAFDSSPSTTFVSNSRDVDKDGIIVGTGLTFISDNNVNISVKYNGELRSHYEAHSFVAQLRYEY